MKHVLRVALGLACLAAALSPAFAQSSAPPKATPKPATAAVKAPANNPATRSSSDRLDGIAAVVNDEVILESDVEEQLYLFLLQSRSRPDSSVIDTLRRQILNQLIDFKLIVAEARRAGIAVNANDRKGIEREVEGAVADVRQRFGTAEEFKRQLEKENMTEAKLREKYRTDLELQLLAQRLVEKQLPKKPITVSEAEAYFKNNPQKFPKVPAQIRVQVIQIPPSADSLADRRGRARIMEIRKRIAGGEKFAKLAGETSDDTNTGRSGGDLGFLPRGSLDQALDQVVFTLKLNELSQPIRSAAGWHVIEVLERDTVKTAAGKDSLDQAGRAALEAHVRHILVRVPVDDSDVERARKLAEKVRGDAVKGADFGALARRFSRYEGKQAEGGDIGLVSMTAFQPTIREGLDAVQVGGISEVLENSAGFNVFKVNERKPERDYQLEEIRDELPQVVAEMKQRERYDGWVKSLRAKTHVEIRGS